MLFMPSLDYGIADGFYDMIDGLLGDIYKQASKITRLATHSGQEHYQVDHIQMNLVMTQKNEIRLINFCLPDFSWMIILQLGFTSFVVFKIFLFYCICHPIWYWDIAMVFIQSYSRRMDHRHKLLGNIELMLFAFWSALYFIPSRTIF